MKLTRVKTFGNNGGLIYENDSTMNCIDIVDTDGDYATIWGKEELEDLIKALQEVLEDEFVE